MPHERDDLIGQLFQQTQQEDCARECERQGKALLDEISSDGPLQTIDWSWGKSQSNKYDTIAFV